MPVGGMDSTIGDTIDLAGVTAGTIGGGTKAGATTTGATTTGAIIIGDGMGFTEVDSITLLIDHSITETLTHIITTKDRTTIALETEEPTTEDVLHTMYKDVPH